MIGIDREPGLSEILLGEASLTSATQRVEFASREGAKISVDVLVAGGLLPPTRRRCLRAKPWHQYLRRHERPTT